MKLVSIVVVRVTSATTLSGNNNKQRLTSREVFSFVTLFPLFYVMVIAGAARTRIASLTSAVNGGNVILVPAASTV